MNTSDGHYHSYLLRFWREGEQQDWHAALISTATQQTYRFVNVDALFAFFHAELGLGERPSASNIEPSDPDVMGS